MKSYPFAQYDAFSATPFGGSQAAIITDAATISLQDRHRLAREIGLPATAFVDRFDDKSVNVQFISTVMELPMCGHGTVCLMTRLCEPGFIAWNSENVHGENVHCVILNLPNGQARVELHSQQDNRPLVYLDTMPSNFRDQKQDIPRLSRILNLDSEEISRELPVEVAVGDFTHLIVPVDTLHTMQKIVPDFSAIIAYCHDYDIETVVVFTRQVEIPGNHVHVRDFCPAVGVPESAAAGTTNAALGTYLIRHQLIEPAQGQIEIRVEQGHEIERPSSIQVIASVSQDQISRLQVGGVATKIMEGEVYL